MHIRRFEGTDMRDALRQVRDALGPDALVLSTATRKKRSGPFGAFGRPVVEVTAAIDRDALKAPSRKPEPEARPGRPDASWNELRITRALVSPLEGEIAALREAVDRLYRESDAGTTRRLSVEVAALRRLALDLRGREAGGSPGPFPESGLAKRHARHLERACTSGLQPEHVLSQMLDPVLAPPRPDDESVTLYVGAAGVGKTTTLAKVAGRSFPAGEDVAVLSTDAHRVASDGPLRAWAREAGVDFRRAASPQSVADAARKLGTRPVLVDTAGCSRRDDAGLQELLRLRDALGSRGRVCLVLPATRKEADLRAELAHFGSLEPEALVVTRLDESDELGNVANLLLDGDCPPLQWIADGQRVPDDLQVADPDDLARRILGAAA